MKPRVFLILFALLSLQALWAQSYHPFPDTNAAWCDERSDNGFPTNYYYFFYKTDGKNDINDTLYTVISDNYGQITFYLREENKRVFCRISPGEPEFLMYNFNVDVGDTVLVPQSAGGPFSAGYVEEADSILIGAEYHKRYFIQCWEWHSMHIIEGVGSDLGLIYFDIPWVDIWGDLYCFSLDGTIFSTDGSGGSEPGNCWQYIGIPESFVEPIEIYPNPVKDYIHVSYDKSCKLELIDLTGRLCRQSSSNIIDVRDLDDGLYILRVYSVTNTLLNQFKIFKLSAR